MDATNKTSWLSLIRRDGGEAGIGRSVVRLAHLAAAAHEADAGNQTPARATPRFALGTSNLAKGLADMDAQTLGQIALGDALQDKEVLQ